MAEMRRTMASDPLLMRSQVWLDKVPGPSVIGQRHVKGGPFTVMALR